MPEPDKAFTQILESYKSAVYAKDVAAFMRLYHPDVRVFDTWGVWEYEGSAAWAVAVEGWLSSLGSERVKVSFQSVKASLSAELSTLSAFVIYTAISADGEELRSMQNRLSWVLKVSGHVPRIVHEHTSAPIGFNDMKAILEKESAS